MARMTPRVDGTRLVGRAGDGEEILVGSSGWYNWLETITTFAFVSDRGRFTARKEQRGRTGWYWKAYRRRAGRLYQAYLGRSADLTPGRLDAVAAELAGEEAPAAHVDPPPRPDGLPPSVADGDPP